MPLIRATRVPGVPASPRSTARAAVGTSALPAWPGITAGWDARCQCTWAMHGGTYQVKYRNTICAVHGGFREGGQP